MSAELFSPITHDRVLTTGVNPTILELKPLGPSKSLVTPVSLNLRDHGRFTVGKISKRFLGLPFLPEWVWVGPGNHEINDIANIPGLTLRRVQ